MKCDEHDRFTMLLYHTATMPRAVKGRAPTRSGLPGVLLVCTRVTHIHIFTCISTRIDASISGGGECLIGGFRADDFVGRSPQKTGAHATRQGAGSTRAAPGSQEFVLVYKLHPSPRHFTSEEVKPVSHSQLLLRAILACQAAESPARGPCCRGSPVSGSRRTRTRIHKHEQILVNY